MTDYRIRPGRFTPGFEILCSTCKPERVIWSSLTWPTEQQFNDVTNYHDDDKHQVPQK